MLQAKQEARRLAEHARSLTGGPEPMEEPVLAAVTSQKQQHQGKEQPAGQPQRSPLRTPDRSASSTPKKSRGAWPQSKSVPAGVILKKRSKGSVIRSGGRTPQGADHSKAPMDGKMVVLTKLISDKEIGSNWEVTSSTGQDMRGLGKPLGITTRQTWPERAAPADVTASIKVENMDYAELHANPEVLRNFQEVMKKTISFAAGPGVNPEHVELALSAGSVIVHATIRPPTGISVKAVATLLHAAPLDQALLESVKDLDGIQAVCKGQLSISEVKVNGPDPLLLSPPFKEVKARGHRERPRQRDAKAQGEKEARRARRALEDAIVLASRIQLLRTEGARTRKKISQALERSEVVVAVGRRSKAFVSQSPDHPEVQRLTEQEQPGNSAAALRLRLEATRSAMLSCNAVLQDRMQVGLAHQAMGTPVQSMPGPSAAVRARLVTARASIAGCNKALMLEVELLSQNLARLVQERGSLRHQQPVLGWQGLASPVE